MLPGTVVLLGRLVPDPVVLLGLVSCPVVLLGGFVLGALVLDGVLLGLVSCPLVLLGGFVLGVFVLDGVLLELVLGLVALPVQRELSGNSLHKSAVPSGDILNCVLVLLD